MADSVPVITTESRASPTIRPLDVQSAQRLSSDQVIRDLGSAVKELVENSLDAGARSIEIRFRNHGLDLIEVVDDGNGISTEDIHVLGRRHYTSKLRQFTDLDQVMSFGFRGEALASLCAVSSRVQLTTTTSIDAPRATRITFDQQGNIIEQTKVARTVGTTVSVEGLLATLPVRRAEFKRNAKREFARGYRWLQYYAVISEGVKFTIRHPSGQGIMLSTDGHADLLGNIGQVYGIVQTKELLPIETTFNLSSSIEEVEEEEEEEKVEDKEEKINRSQKCTIIGYISRTEQGCGRSSGDRQLLYLNRRPIQLPKMIKMLNDVYRTLNVQPMPVAFINIQLAPNEYDVNVTPDKRTVMIHYESSIIEHLKTYIENIYQPTQRTFKLQSNLHHFSSSFEIIDDTAKIDDTTHSSSPAISLRSTSGEMANMNLLSSSPSMSNTDFQAKDISQILEKEQSIPIDDIIDKSEPEPVITLNTESINRSSYKVQSISPDKHQTTLTTFINDRVPTQPTRNYELLIENEPLIQDNTVETTTVNVYGDIALSTLQSSSQPSLASKSTGVQEEESIDKEEEQEEVINKEAVDKKEERMDKEGEITNKTKRQRSPSLLEDSSLISSKRSANLENVEIMTTFNKDICYTYHEQLKDNSSDNNNNNNNSHSNNNPITSLAQNQYKLRMEAGITSDQTTAEEALSRVVKKDDFYRMEIIGQFNHGFILVLLPYTDMNNDGNTILNKRHQGDLFIIDQHAADEKWWYEKLITQPRTRPQPLLRPRPLHVGESERVAIIEHLEVFQRNGYTIEVDNQGRPMIIAQPVDVDALADIEELASRIQEGDDLRTLCPSKFLSQCASKACRRAVMIGDPLNKSQMEKIVRQLGELQHPWNCPHGRPTMRHLANMNLLD
ncbi:hypothetical protein BDF19DRAFT_451072 [Syncephalis fuscata]|nr:hypothetical protein BDF19DRAFT_451072 [Syncephalis fuscata]